MTYSCPKCTAEIEFDLAQIPEEGTSSSCPQCNARFDLLRESFAGRALRKSGHLNCIKCGNRLGYTIHCRGCGAVYPDYLIAEPPDARRRRQARKRWESLKGFDFSFTSSQAASTGYSPQAQTAAISATNGANQTKKIIVAVMSVVVLIGVLVGGITKYKEYLAEKAYTESFFKALYCIKSGNDLSLTTCTKIATDMKTKLDSGRVVTPYTPPEDAAQLNKLKASTDKLMQQLKEPPPKLQKVNSSLTALNSAYTQAHVLAVAPPPLPLPAYIEASAKADSEFKRVAQEFKASLPQNLSKKLQQAKIKYKILKDF